MFERIEKGSTQIPITASIVSITQARARADAQNEDVFEAEARSNASARSTTAARSQPQSSSQSGGLLGGVGNTVGGVVNNTTSVAGNVVGNTTAAVSSTVGATTRAGADTTGNVASSLGRIQIMHSTDASVQSSSTLTLQGGNLRLEHGTTFKLLITSSASSGNSP